MESYERMSQDEMEFFCQAAVTICGSLDIDLILSRCKRFFKTYFPIDGILMGFFDPAEKAIHKISCASDQKAAVPEGVVYVPREVADILISRRNQPERISIINTPDDQPEIARWWQAMGRPEGSGMSMQLSLDKEHIGFVTIIARGRNRYETSHGRMFSLLRSPFAVALNNVRQHRELVQLKDALTEDNRYLTRQLQRRRSDAIVGADKGLKRVMALVYKVAPLNSQVLLLGETGVGKEVIANAVHQASARANAPFIKVNCGAIPESLIDSELFGHEKGAFSGAVARKRGWFERAHKGTIFLDEIGELPLNAQVRLLRVIQNREIERVGGGETVSVDIRIIAATHRDLERMVAQGKFREDLWFRLNVLPITIPPLRDRIEDIPDLVRFLIKKKAGDMNFDYLPEPAPGLMDLLKQRSWNGNIRELENTIERVLIRHLGAPKGTSLKADGLLWDSPAADKTVEHPSLALRSLDSVMADHIRAVMAHTRGKIQGRDGAAAILGIHPSTLRCRMKKLGIPFGRSTSSEYRS